MSRRKRDRQHTPQVGDTSSTHGPNAPAPANPDTFDPTDPEQAANLLREVFGEEDAQWYLQRHRAAVDAVSRGEEPPAQPAPTPAQRWAVAIHNFKKTVAGKLWPDAAGLAGKAEEADWMPVMNIRQRIVIWIGGLALLLTTIYSTFAVPLPGSKWDFQSWERAKAPLPTGPDHPGQFDLRLCEGPGLGGDRRQQWMHGLLERLPLGQRRLDKASQRPQRLRLRVASTRAC